MLDINTLSESIELLLNLGEINIIFVGMIAYLVGSFTDIFKLFFPGLKKWVIPFAWITSIVFALLLILAGKVGVIIIAIFILASVIVKSASGDHAQKKAISKQGEDYIPGELGDHLEMG